MTQSHQNIVGLDSAIMVHPDVWEASGHIANFNDPMTDNKDNKKRYRIDDLLSQQKSKVIDAICVALKMDSTNNDDIYNHSVMEPVVYLLVAFPGNIDMELR